MIFRHFSTGMQVFENINGFSAEESAIKVARVGVFEARFFGKFNERFLSENLIYITENSHTHTKMSENHNCEVRVQIGLSGTKIITKSARNTIFFDFSLSSLISH